MIRQKDVLHTSNYSAYIKWKTTGKTKLTSLSKLVADLSVFLPGKYGMLYQILSKSERLLFFTNFQEDSKHICSKSTCHVWKFKIVMNPY